MNDFSLEVLVNFSLRVSRVLFCETQLRSCPEEGVEGSPQKPQPKSKEEIDHV